MSIEAGTVYVIMGLSGSGKSTMIRHFNRLIEPTSGSIRIDGEDILKLNQSELRYLRQAKMSMVFQSFGLMPHRTVIENVGYGLEVRGEARAERTTKAKTWIDRVGLGGYEDLYPAQLSGGMRQRVGLARGLATNPDIMLMDEAFSALDPLIRQDMQQILLDLQSELRKTIIFITHDLGEALAIGDRIAILNDGCIIQDGTPEDIVLRPQDTLVRRSAANVNRAKALCARSVMITEVAQVNAADKTVTVKVTDSLETALVKTADSAGAVVVLDKEARPCGCISRRLIIDAISTDGGYRK